MRRRDTRNVPTAAPDTQSEGFSPETLLGPLSPLAVLHAPSRLYVAGRHAWLRERPKVSVVGSRQASPDSLKRTQRLATLLAQQGVIVVSGLAAGVDTAAHEAAIKAGGRTIAVIGTPLTETYPAQNRLLQQRLMREHLVVSQFPDGYPILRKNFPMRNRTMALLVDASVIVEAGDTSGTLSQGWEALRLGRPLFLLKSIVERSDLSWPRTMLDYGAMILSNVDELLARLPTSADDPLAALA